MDINRYSLGNISDWVVIQTGDRQYDLAYVPNSYSSLDNLMIRIYDYRENIDFRPDLIRDKLENISWKALSQSKLTVLKTANPSSTGRYIHVMFPHLTFTVCFLRASKLTKKQVIILKNRLIILYNYLFDQNHPLLK